jgi:hypothetical protein
MPYITSGGDRILIWAATDGIAVQQVQPERSAVTDSSYEHFTRLPLVDGCTGSGLFLATKRIDILWAY